MGKHHLKNRLRRNLSLTGFTPLEIRRPRRLDVPPKAGLSLTGFTLIEIIIAFLIFSIIMGLVLTFLVGSFRSFNSAQLISSREGKQRQLFFWLSKEVSSLVKAKKSFKGLSKEFFFTFAKADRLSEARYVCNANDKTLERYYEEPADYDETTYQAREIKLSDIDECFFSYNDGKVWSDEWSGGKEGLPSIIKIIFRFKGEDHARELLMDVPVSR